MLITVIHEFCPACISHWLTTLFPTLVDCAPGCKDGWIGDGECDEACRYSAACQYDAGDCDSAPTSVPVPTSGLPTPAGLFTVARRGPARRGRSDISDSTPVVHYKPWDASCCLCHFLGAPDSVSLIGVDSRSQGQVSREYVVAKTNGHGR